MSVLLRLNNINSNYMAVGTVFVIEFVFFLIFHFYLIPRANQRTAPQQYRNYVTDRHKLLLRILHRLERFAKHQNHKSTREVLSNFLLQWFHVDQESEELSPPAPLPLLTHHETASTASSSSSPYSSSSSSSEEEGLSSEDASETESSADIWTIPDLGKAQIEEFFAWAFFGKEKADLSDWQEQELQMCFDQLESQTGLVFSAQRSKKYKPRRLTLENVSPWHRPLLVYLVIAIIKFVIGCLLRLLGFRRLVSSQGLGCWHRPARGKDAGALLPLLFFHGIAPGGLLLYLPMVLLGLAYDGRAVFLFENKPISCAIGFDALSEGETVAGVNEIVNQCIGPDGPLSLVGHSFGSCQLTWLLHSPELQSRIRQFVLMDPVTILLSEPDVMVNFLYSQENSKIRVLASSELFTEYYLRRHFSWYNSELWLEDIPKHVQVLIALAHDDEIVNAPKIKNHLDFMFKCCDESMQLLYWRNAKHAACVTSVSKWRQTKQAMLEQELSLLWQE